MVQLFKENKAVDLFSQLLHLLLLGIVQVEGEKVLSSQECSDLGFTAQLSCGWCSTLDDFNLQVVKEGCLKCCEEEVEESAVKKYHGATLEVCGWKLGRYPQIQAFVKEGKAKKFPNFNVKYVRGADPTIKLHSEGKQDEEILSVGKWDTDNLEEFLMEKIKM